LSSPATCPRKNLRQRFPAFSNRRAKARCAQRLPVNSQSRRRRTVRSERSRCALDRRLVVRRQHAPSAPQCYGHDKGVCDAARHRHPRFMCHRKRDERHGPANTWCKRLTFYSEATLKSALCQMVHAPGCYAIQTVGTCHRCSPEQSIARGTESTASMPAERQTNLANFRAPRITRDVRTFYHAMCSLRAMGTEFLTHREVA